MKESYSEVLARHAGPKPYAGDGNVAGVAWVTGTHRRSIELRNPYQSVCRPCSGRGKATSRRTLMASATRTRRSRRPIACVETSNARTGRSHWFPVKRSRAIWRGRTENLTEGTAVMNANGKSDDFIVPAKRANKTGTPAAEFAEGRKSPKRSHVRFVVAPDTAPESAIHQASAHARHVAMLQSRPSSLNGGAV
jgi:hypothetical protein